MEKRGSEVDQLCTFDLRPSLQGWSRGDENPVATMRAAPDRIFRWTMLLNDHRWLVAILGQTWRRREEAVLAPPVENEVSGLVGKRTLEELVASINAGNYRFTGPWIFKLQQFRHDKVSERAVLRWFHNATGLYSFPDNPDVGWA